MTENEAIKMLKAKLTCMKLEALSCIEKGCDKDCECCEYNYAQGNMGEQKEALDIAIQSLEEIQKYRAIGTLEECREAVEKMKPKKVQKIQIPNTSWTKAQTRFECPSCHKYLNYRELSHCGLCGQRLLWEE